MSKISDKKLQEYINEMLTKRKERKFVETVDLQIGLKVRFLFRTMTLIKKKDLLDQ